MHMQKQRQGKSKDKGRAKAHAQAMQRQGKGNGKSMQRHGTRQSIRQSIRQPKNNINNTWSTHEIHKKTIKSSRTEQTIKNMCGNVTSNMLKEL